MDGITLDHLISEVRVALAGRHVARPRAVGAQALALEVLGGRGLRLRLDAGRGTAGAYLLDRDQARALDAPDAEIPGRTRQALLLFRKHLDGARVTEISRIPGERTIVLKTTRGLVAFRLSGAAPAFTLVVDGAPLATVGNGVPAWPLPPPAPEREWGLIAAAALEKATARAAASGRALSRVVLAACPPLGPLLAREVDGPGALESLRARLAFPRPTLLVPRPLDECHDADLVALDAVALAPIPLGEPRVALHPPTWRAAATLFLQARERGARFEARRRLALAAARRDARRLSQLEAHLAGDLAGLGDAGVLRRRAEALLAAPGPLVPGAREADVPDPYAPGARLRFTIDPGLSPPANADRLFLKARRLEKAQVQVEARLAETRLALAAARGREARAAAARDLGELQGTGVSAAPASALEPRPERGGPRRYLTSRGLSLLVGRGARENHRLTFGLARPEDVWLHARDVPGAHVILRDNEGRATGEDLREAAEVAAFFSEARGNATADVHVTRRKHVRPAGGGPGRVHVGHSETLHVVPRDPAGRLRRR